MVCSGILLCFYFCSSFYIKLFDENSRAVFWFSFSYVTQYVPLSYLVQSFNSKYNNSQLFPYDQYPCDMQSLFPIFTSKSHFIPWHPKKSFFTMVTTLQPLWIYCFWNKHIFHQIIGFKPDLPICNVFSICLACCSPLNSLLYITQFQIFASSSPNLNEPITLFPHYKMYVHENSLAYLATSTLLSIHNII